MSAPAMEPRSRNQYTVGWICGLVTERTAATAMLDQEHDSNLPNPVNDGNAYTLGSIGNHNIVIACLPLGKIGNNQAATVATRMVTTFPFIKIVLLVGIGGGIPPKVKLGDIVVSTPVDQYPGVVQWDFGKEGKDFKRTGALNNPPTVLLTALTELATRHRMRGTSIPRYLGVLGKNHPALVPEYTSNEFLNDPLFAPDNPHNSHGRGTTEIAKLNGTQRKPGDVKVHYGLIASGNKVIKNAEVRDSLNASLGGGVLCVETEAAGLMAVDVPCIVIRGICNYADSQKNKDWQPYAATVAAAFAKELLGYVQPSDVDRGRSVMELLGQD